MKKTNKHPLTFFREANEARAKLVKKSMGGPGSGMGSMYLNDLANEAMMATPSTPPTAPAPPRESSGPYGNTTPGQIYKKPSYKDYIKESPTPPTNMRDLDRGDFSPASRGGKGFGNTTPGSMSPLNKNKKGGPVKRKKK